MAILHRRTLLKTAALLPLGARVVSAAPAGEPITPALIEAAKKEGKVSYYNAMDLSVVEPMAKAFEAKFPGIKVQVERSGAERVFNRIAQEMASKIYRADVVNSSDAAHFIAWKREGWLAPYLPDDVVKDVAADMVDADGTYYTQRIHLSAMAYNSKLLAPADAPKGFMDLLDPKYVGKMVKGHPGYSGTIMTATQQMARELGWPYFEKLAKQKVLQVQSATEPPKRIEVVFPVEGTPQISNPMGVFKSSQNPNAARLLVSWIMSPEGQKFIVDLSGQYPVNKRVKQKEGRPALSSLKLWREEPAVVADKADQIKAQYAKYFKV
jgi:iron(III) transport system substrate-binding protein